MKERLRPKDYYIRYETPLLAICFLLTIIAILVALIGKSDAVSILANSIIYVGAYLFGIHYNKINLAHLPAALYYYFFDYLNFKPEFPYINIGSHFVNHTGNMIYNEANFGVFALPITWVSLILFKKRFVENKNIYAFRIAAVVSVIVALMCLIQKEYIESRSRVLSLAIMSITTVVAVLLVFIIVNHDVSYICEINPRMYLKHFRMWRL